MVQSVWCVLQRVVYTVDLATLDLRDFLANNLKGLDEAVNFDFVLGLGGFDHETTDNRPTHRGRVEAEVHEPLGDVFFGDAGCLLEHAAVENQLVGYATLLTPKDDLVVVL